MSLQCSKCNMTKTKGEFYRQRDTKRGYTNYCKYCFNITNLESKQPKQPPKDNRISRLGISWDYD